MAFRWPKRSAVEPHEDYGFFGPDSRDLEGLELSDLADGRLPALRRGRGARPGPDRRRRRRRSAVRYRPRTRYDRTLRYFATVALGEHALGDPRPPTCSSRSTPRRSAPSRSAAIRYDANDPALAAVDPPDRLALDPLRLRALRPGPALDRRTRRGTGRSARSPPSCRPATPRTSRARARASASTSRTMRPKLAGSEAAQSMMEHLLNAEVMLPPMPRSSAPGAWVVNKVAARGDDRDDAALDAEDGRAAPEPSRRRRW